MAVGKCWCFLVFLMLATVWPGAAGAEEPDASQQLFLQGWRQQYTKQYAQAVVSYSQAADLTTTAYRAYISRQQGNCYYYLGLTREALVAYGQYLSVYRDPKAWQFADALRKWMLAHPSSLPRPAPQPEKETKEDSNRFGALWRSALVPGWGQWNRGDNWRGAGYFAFTVVPFGLAFMYQSTANANYDAYQKTIDPAKAAALRAQVTSGDQAAAGMNSVALAFYALNLADAFFFSTSPESTAWKPGIGPYAQNAGIPGASLSWRF
jgi:hypothetical protein